MELSSFEDEFNVSTLKQNTKLLTNVRLTLLHTIWLNMLAEHHELDALQRR